MRAVIVGAGPNGLAAGLRLAELGYETTIYEARDDPYGGTGPGEELVPGLVTDHCSAFHPLAIGSPAWKALENGGSQLEWAHPEIPCAHAFLGRESAFLRRDLAAMSRDWQRLFGPIVETFGKLLEDVTKPILHRPAHPVALAAFGLRAMLPASLIADGLRKETDQALFLGVAAHSFSSLTLPLSSSIGLMLAAAAHVRGWPVVVGGSHALIDAATTVFNERGGRIECGVRVTSARELPAADVTLLNVAPAQVLTLYGDRVPPKIRDAYMGYRTGACVFKVDLALCGDIPWVDRALVDAGTVHLCGDRQAVLNAAHERAAGLMPSSPFILVGQQYRSDRTRSAGSVNPVYAYTQVPSGYQGDGVEIILTVLERYAPGIRDLVVSAHGTPVLAMEQWDSSFYGGDIVGGLNSRLQMVFRPKISARPYFTGMPGVYLCSQFTPPGAGAHGLCGMNAANAAHHDRLLA